MRKGVKRFEAMMASVAHPCCNLFDEAPRELKLEIVHTEILNYKNWYEGERRSGWKRFRHWLAGIDRVQVFGWWMPLPLNVFGRSLREEYARLFPERSAMLTKAHLWMLGEAMSDEIHKKAEERSFARQVFGVRPMP